MICSVPTIVVIVCVAKLKSCRGPREISSDIAYDAEQMICQFWPGCVYTTKVNTY